MYLDEILKRYQEEAEITSSVLLLFLAAIISLWSLLFHVVFSQEFSKWSVAWVLHITFMNQNGCQG